MTRILNKLLIAKLAELDRGDSAPAMIEALTYVAGDTTTDIRIATEATAKVAELLRQECQGLVLSRADGSNLFHDLRGLPRARQAIEARSIASSKVMWHARQSRGAE
jgi:hypothetical protein